MKSQASEVDIQTRPWPEHCTVRLHTYNEETLEEQVIPVTVSRFTYDDDTDTLTLFSENDTVAVFVGSEVTCIHWTHTERRKYAQ